MNPKLSKFIEDNPDMSLLGFVWAGYWRLTLVIAALYFVLALLIIIIAAASH